MAIGSTRVPYRSNASTSRSVTAPPESPAALATADRQEEPGEVLTARAAGQQVSGHPGIMPARVLAPGHEVDIDVQDSHRLVAAGIARVGPQEPLQSAQVCHRCSKPGSSRYPLATSARRILRRASKITL